jgi:uncharacterized membrane protein
MIEYILSVYGNEIIGGLLVAIFGTLGWFFGRVWREHINDDTKRAIAKSVVLFVEQVWISLHGKEKLKKALEVAEIFLKKKGIKFDAGEMTVLIEAAVAEFNEAFKKPIDSENAAATRITEE